MKNLKKLSRNELKVIIGGNVPEEGNFKCTCGCGGSCVTSVDTGGQCSSYCDSCCHRV